MRVYACYVVLEVYRITLLSNTARRSNTGSPVLEVYRITLLSNNLANVFYYPDVLEVYRITLLSNMVDTRNYK